MYCIENSSLSFKGGLRRNSDTKILENKSEVKHGQTSRAQNILQVYFNFHGSLEGV